MKRILLISILLIQSFLGLQSLAEEEMSPSMQANLFYADNNIAKTYEILLAIPTLQRSAQDWLLLGNILQDQGKTAEAQFMYTRATIIDKKFYKAYYNLANTYLESEQPFLAILNYKKAIHAKENFAFAHYNLGCAYIKTKEFKKAKNAFLQAISIDNTQPDFYYNLAYVYKRLGKEKASKNYLEFYKKALDLKVEK